MVYLPILVSFFVLVFIYFLFRKKNSSAENHELARDLSCLKKQVRKTNFLVLIAFLFFLFWIIFGFKIALGFAAGVILFLFLSFAGLFLSGLGFSQGLFIMASGLLFESGLYVLFQDWKPLMSLVFGVSLFSLFIKPDNAKKITDFSCTYLLGLTAAGLLGIQSFTDQKMAFSFPFFIVGAAILALTLVSLPLLTFNKRIIGFIPLSLFGFFWVIKNFAQFSEFPFWRIYLSVLVSFLIGGALLFVAQKNRSGSVIFPIVLLSLGMMISFWLADTLALAVFLISSLVLAGAVWTLEEKMQIFTFFYSALAVLSLFLVYLQEAQELGYAVFSLGNYKVVAGLLLGGLLSHFLIPRAIKIIETVLILILPVLVGFILGPEALAGLLMGSIITGIFIAAVNPMIKAINIVALLIVGFLV